MDAERLGEHLAVFRDRAQALDQLGGARLIQLIFPEDRLESLFFERSGAPVPEEDRIVCDVEKARRVTLQLGPRAHAMGAIAAAAGADSLLQSIGHPVIGVMAGRARSSLIARQDRIEKQQIAKLHA